MFHNYKTVNVSYPKSVSRELFSASRLQTFLTFLFLPTDTSYMEVRPKNQNEKHEVGTESVNLAETVRFQTACKYSFILLKKFIVS